MAGACIAALLFVLAAPPAKPAGPAPAARIIERVERDRLSDEDVRRLLRDWALFERAMASLHDAVPQIPQDGGDASDLDAAERAWAADARVRGVLRKGGTTPEAFLATYRRTADAWWELVEREAQADVAEALRREIAALRELDDPQAAEALAGLERGLAAVETSGPPPPDVALVKRHRAQLEGIFSPAAPPAP